MSVHKTCVFVGGGSYGYTHKHTYTHTYISHIIQVVVCVRVVCVCVYLCARVYLRVCVCAYVCALCVGEWFSGCLLWGGISTVRCIADDGRRQSTRVRVNDECC